MDATGDLKASFHSRTRPLHAVPKGITDTGSHHISRGVRPSMCLRTVQFGSVRFGFGFELGLGNVVAKRKWRSRAEQGAEVGHSFTLFKCQITFVPGMPCAAWSRRQCCIICLINCTADGARSRVMCQANANGDTLLPTCHPLHAHPFSPSASLAIDRSFADTCIDFCAKLMLTFIINLQIENEHLH